MEKDGVSFLYLPVSFDESNIAALIDTGSSINVISKDLFYSMPERFKLSYSQSTADIKLANDGCVKVLGVANILINVPQGQHEIEVYILQNTSHPLILGTKYLQENNVVLDFSNSTFNVRSAKVTSCKRISIEPNTETIIWGRLPQYVSTGLNGVCSNSQFVLSHGLMVGKTLVTVSSTHKVPIRLLNTTAHSVLIPKGKNIAQFSTLGSDYSYVPFTGETQIVQNIQLATADITSGLNYEKNETPVDQVKQCPDERLEDIKNEFNLSPHLSDSERNKLAECLRDNYDIFVTDANPNIGFTNVVEHQITLKDDAVGKHHKPYRLSPEKREILRHHLDRLLEQGIIRPVKETDDLPISSPIVLVMKRKDSKDKQSPQNFRFCCDFRYLNSQTKDFRYNIPNLQELTESFSTVTPNYMTSIDMSSGFFQMSLSENSSRYTAFNTCFGTYQFLRLPMGLKTSPNTFQLMMDKVLKGLQFKICLCYLDDVLICSETFEQHLEDLNEVFARFRSAGLKLGPRKCTFATDKCIFLGHQISKDGIHPPPDRVDALLKIPPPSNVRQLRRIIGMFNWFRKFIPNFSAIISPLARLLKKNQHFKWTSDQQNAFDHLKQLLTSAPFLSFPRFDLPFRLAVDTSSRGLGYMLYQLDPNDSEQQPRIIRYGSKALNSWQMSYGPTKLELLGMVVSVMECSDYLRGNKFVVECDHEALQPLFQKQFKGAIYERWLSLLQQFHFEIVYKPAADMQLPDALSRCPEVAQVLSESPAEEDPFFPYMEESIGQITLPDGSDLIDRLNPNKENETKFVQAIQSTSISSATDPYDADTDESSDSMGNTGAKLKRSKDRKQKRNVEKVSVVDSEMFRRLNMDLSVFANHQKNDENFGKIIAYLTDNTLPNSQKDARRLLLEAPDYILLDNVLYRSRSPKSARNKLMSPYQVVVPANLIPEVLRLAHDSPLGGHCGINNTIDRIREFFFFPRMGKIITDYVRSCHECQTRKTSNMKTKAKIVAYPVPTQPFQVWQIDLLGPLPICSSGNSYVFTALDMFSKFVFALPIRNKDVATVSEAIFQLTTNFGVPQTLISDQGQEFMGKCTKKVGTLLGLHQEFIPSYIHHCLGACERTHRTIEERLTPYFQNNAQWDTILSSVIFSINSSAHAGTHYSPFEVLYGQRPRFGLTNIVTDFDDVPPTLHSYMQDLCNKLRIIQQDIHNNMQISKNDMEQRENKKHNEIKLKEGDYVYLEIEPSGQGSKLKKNCEGPFVVRVVLSDHRVQLSDPKGKRTFKTPVHINRLKIAHVREPNPQPFLDRRDNHETFNGTTEDISSDEINNDSDAVSVRSDSDTESVDKTEKNNNIRRSTRARKIPLRYRDPDHVDPDEVESSSADVTVVVHKENRKIKRVLAKKRNKGSFLYLVQMIGEPAQNAKWLPINQLSSKIQDTIKTRPPPLVN